MDAGVPAGASSAPHEVTSKPRTPDSSTVGVWGNAEARFNEVTANARSFTQARLFGPLAVDARRRGGGLNVDAHRRGPADPELSASQRWREMEERAVSRARGAPALQSRRLARLVRLPRHWLRPQSRDP